MSMSKAKGYHDGREGRLREPEYGIVDHLLSSPKRSAEMVKEDREYAEGYREGKKDRDRSS
jgi:hypothetical protein